jgi:hypothetical protein
MAENPAVLVYLKVVGDQLEALQTAGISVVLRRLQEGSGKWFCCNFDGVMTKIPLEILELIIELK